MVVLQPVVSPGEPIRGQNKVQWHLRAQPQDVERVISGGHGAYPVTFGDGCTKLRGVLYPDFGLPTRHPVYDQFGSEPLLGTAFASRCPNRNSPSWASSALKFPTPEHQ